MSKQKEMDDKQSTKKDVYQNLEVKKLPKSEVEIKAEIPVSLITKLWPKAVESVANHVKMDGFRDGKVPEAMLIKQVGEMVVMEEVAELALREVYPAILIDQKIDALGSPKVSITKLAKDNPIGFTITTAVMPSLTLKDEHKKKISKINAERKPTEVTDKDMDEVIKTLRENRARLLKKKSGTDHNHDHAHNENDGHNHDHAHDEKIDEKDLPAFDDEFVKTLGDFKDIADFKEKMKGEILKDKERIEKDKRRSAIADVLIASSEVDLPELLVENELQKMFDQFRGEIEHAGMSFEQYMKEVKKTEEEIKKEWRPSAERRVIMQLALQHVSVNNNITADKDELEKEVDVLLSIYKNADRARVRAYAEAVLSNEKVFEFLENIK